MRNLAAILCIALIVAGCGRQRPGGVLSRNDMAAVLIDYHLAYQMAQELPANERYKAPIYIESALSKHGISQSNFDKSMQWYAGNPHELQIVYSRVNKDLKDLETAISDNATSGEAITFNRYRQHSFPIGDSVNVWQQESVYQLTSLFSQRRVQASAR